MSEDICPKCGHVLSLHYNSKRDYSPYDDNYDRERARCCRGKDSKGNRCDCRVDCHGNGLKDKQPVFDLFDPKDDVI